jgi:Ca2+-binding EF-hand superfamily protein
LKSEFSKIDMNADGTITRDELIRFLNQQTNGTVETAIAEEIFRELDDGGDGVVVLDEFISNYF